MGDLQNRVPELRSGTVARVKQETFLYPLALFTHLRVEQWHRVSLEGEQKTINVKRKTSSSSVGASVALLIFLIEFIYLSSFNNLRCSTQWYANELFKFNEFLMTRQIIS